jgi:hypothetical protein
MDITAERPPRDDLVTLQAATGDRRMGLTQASPSTTVPTPFMLAWTTQ